VKNQRAGQRQYMLVAASKDRSKDKRHVLYLFHHICGLGQDMPGPKFLQFQMIKSVLPCSNLTSLPGLANPSRDEQYGLLASYLVSR